MCERDMLDVMEETMQSEDRQALAGFFAYTDKLQIKASSAFDEFVSYATAVHSARRTRDLIYSNLF